MDFNKEDLMAGLFGDTTENNFGQMLPEVIERKIIKVPLALIDDLKSVEHAYEKSLQMGLGIEELAEQIKAVGQQQPAVVRKKDDGRYELIIGHRRKRACIMSDTKTLDVIVIDCTDDEAASISVDNLGQRPHTFPSEIAKAYKIQLNALKRQGKRTDLEKTLDKGNNFGQTLPEVNARNILAEKNKISPRSVSNFLRLNQLVPELLDMIDSKAIPFIAGIHLSYLKEREQLDLAKLLEADSNIKVTINTAEELRSASKEMQLSELTIEATVNPPTEEKMTQFKEKKSKPAYKIAFQLAEKKLKRLPEEEAVKLEMCDKDELQKVISDAVDRYLQTL